MRPKQTNRSDSSLVRLSRAHHLIVAAACARRHPPLSPHPCTHSCRPSRRRASASDCDSCRSRSTRRSPPAPPPPAVRTPHRRSSFVAARFVLAVCVLISDLVCDIIGRRQHAHESHSYTTFTRNAQRIKHATYTHHAHDTTLHSNTLHCTAQRHMRRCSPRRRCRRRQRQRPVRATQTHSTIDSALGGGIQG